MTWPDLSSRSSAVYSGSKGALLTDIAKPEASNNWASTPRCDGGINQLLLLEHALFFFFFWLCWVLIAARGLSLVAASGGYSLCCGAWASHCSGFSCCGARALGAQASVVVAHGLSSCVSWALERRLSSCGAQA